MKKLTTLIITLIGIVYFQSCTDDDFDTRIAPNLQTEADVLRDEEFIAENFGNFTTGNFFGIVEDQYGGKLNNVQVTIGNTIAYTDRNGMFLIRNADVYENFAHIKTQKEGYINGSRVVIPKTDGENRVQISMFKKEITASVNSGESSTVELDNGAKVNFSGGFFRQDGSAYTGQVDVVLQYLQPNSINTFRLMPGSLFAQDSNNDARILQTYGMISVNLFSPSGERLNINQFNRATIEIPIDYSSQNTVPDFIPLWHFDEERGYWKEEGQAVRLSNMYVAEVSHFTWWNYDIPFDSVELCFSLSEISSDDTAPYQVLIRRPSTGQYIYYGFMTANQGIECGLIPRNEEIQINLYESSGICTGQLVHNQNLGGFTTDTTVDISFSNDNPNTTTITGLATNCNGNPITNGYVYIDDVNTYFITAGTINISLTHCDTTNAIIQVFDFDSNQWAVIENVPLNGEAINLGNISTCEDSGGIFNGNLVLSTQQEVDEFGAFGFTSINGSLTIGSEESYTNITDLSPLSSIVYIDGNLTIVGNENLTNLQALSSITNVQGFELLIKNNPSITSLVGFDNLSSVQTLTIDNNDALTSLVGFSSSFSIGQNLRVFNNANLTSLQGIENFGWNSEKDLRISNNDALTSLQGVENITQLRFLTIENNDALNSLTAFESLTQLLDLTINNNDALVTLVGLEQLIELRILIIANNEALQNLNGLNNLAALTPSIFNAVNIGAIQWENFCTGYTDGPNPNLSDFCAIDTLINAYEWNIDGNTRCAVIVNNAYNPTPLDFLDGNCSQ